VNPQPSSPKKASSLRLAEFSRHNFPLTFSALERAVTDRVAPGFVAGLWTRAEPDLYRAAAVGVRRWQPSEESIAIDTIFDLSSVSKIFGTSTLIALLIEQGRLKWTTSLQEIFPLYPYREIQLRHLLSHTAGFIAWQPLWERLRERFPGKKLEDVSVEDRQRAMREIVLKIAPEVPVETRVLYSDISFLLLGFVIEEVTGLPLDRAVMELLWRPMGIERSYYSRVTASPTQQIDEKVAATEISGWRGGLLQGQVHDDNTWAMGGYAGHSGAFGDARDLLFFARQLMSGYLPLRIRDEMWTRVDWPAGCERTQGWDTPSVNKSLLGELMSRRSVGHWGFTGTSLWIDRDREIAVTLLSNRVHPTRDNNLMKEFRPVFHDALVSDFDSFKSP
jgi:CubicO group peptidase (beta-lactamase class C family)